MSDNLAGTSLVEREVRPALVERLRHNYDGWLPTSDHTLEAHNLLAEAAAALDVMGAEIAKMRECLTWLQERHHGGLMRAKIDEALRA